MIQPLTESINIMPITTSGHNPTPDLDIVPPKHYDALDTIYIVHPTKYTNYLTVSPSPLDCSENPGYPGLIGTDKPGQRVLAYSTAAGPHLNNTQVRTQNRILIPWQKGLFQSVMKIKIMQSKILFMEILTGHC